MSTAAVDMKVEIDDRIRADPALLRAVTEATEYLRTLPSRIPPPAAVRWRYDGTGAVELALTDHVGTPAYPATRTTPAPRMTDPDTRERLVLRTWFDLLTLRSAEINTRIDRLLDEYEEGEPDAE